MKDWGTLIYFQLKRIQAEKIDLDDFVDEVYSRHDIEVLSYIELLMIKILT